jgi:hypothetical protein
MVVFIIQETPGTLALAGKALPSVALICSNCGYTRLLNMMILGVGDMAEPKPETSESKGDR